jgi:hypothetical protein
MSEILSMRSATLRLPAALSRVDCVAVGPNNQQRPSGTLLIPGPQAGAGLTALVNGKKELHRKQQEQAATPAGRDKAATPLGYRAANRSRPDRS